MGGETRRETHSPEVLAVLGDIVGEWPDVRARKVFGHPGFTTRRKLFCFVAGDDVVLMKLAEDSDAALAAAYEVGPFIAMGEPMRGWVQVRLPSAEEVVALAPYLRESYELALAKAG